jgi:multiple sugar transport system permease protein
MSRENRNGVRESGGEKTSLLRRRSTPYLMLAPVLLGLFLLVYYPLLTTLRLSFYRYAWNKPQAGSTFVGVKNYTRIFTDRYEFWPSVENTITFTVISTSLCILIGLGLALFVDRQFKGKTAYVSLLLLPTMIAPVVSGLTWKLMFDGMFGAVNYFMVLLGLEPRAWLSSSATALGCVIVADVWQYSPFVFLVMLASLQAIPSELFEAARIDGASGWTLFSRLKLPMIMPQLLLVGVIRLMDTFRVFDLIYLMTNGGPAGSTQTLGFLCYQRTFRHFKMGEGAVIAIFILAAVLILSFYFIKSLLENARGLAR